jgi:hypothetical protein
MGDITHVHVLASGNVGYFLHLPRLLGKTRFPKTVIHRKCDGFLLTAPTNSLLEIYDDNNRNGSRIVDLLSI